MIPTNLPLAHSSLTQKMTNGERSELADQWYAMMIKEDGSAQGSAHGSVNEVPSALSSLTPSYVSSRDSQQEQRDPNSNDRAYHNQYPERLLGKHAQYRDHPDVYPSKKGLTQNQQQQQLDQEDRYKHHDAQQNTNSKTDFLDGIIKSLSELSSGEGVSRRAESSSFLKESKNGWSILDSHRRIQENIDESQSKLHDRSPHMSKEANTDASNKYYTSDPVVRSRYETREDSSHNDRMSGEREPPNPPPKYEPHSLGNRSQRAAITIPASEALRISKGKIRSWNVDKSHGDKSRRDKSLFEPMSPESAVSPSSDRAEIYALSKPPIPLSTPNLTEHAQGILVETKASNEVDKYSTEPESSLDRQSGTRDRSPSLAFSSSKDAGQILKHFMPRSCGPVNGESPLSSVAGFFEKPSSHLTSPQNCATYGRTPSSENYPSRSRSEHSKGEKRLPGKSRRSPEPFRDGGRRRTPGKSRRSPEPSRAGDRKRTPGKSRRSPEPYTDADRKLPKTRTQQNLEKEILWEAYKHGKGPEVRDQRSTKRSSANENENENSIRKEEARNGDDRSSEKAVWGSSEHREATAGMVDYRHQEPRASIVRIEPRQGIETSRTNENPRFDTHFRSIATSELPQNVPASAGGNPGVDDSFMQQFVRCNAPMQEESGFSMFERIQRQINGPSVVDVSGFPMENHEKMNNNDKDQRIQEKLDAVRVRSIRNAQIIEGMQNEELKKTSQNDEARSENSAKTLVEEMESTTERSHSVSATNHENEISHYMYVAYSQFGQNAQNVLKLCGHHTIPAPDRRKGEILVKINASTVSAFDCAIRRGEWTNISMDPYIIPGVALVGKVMGREKKKSRPSSSNIEPGDTVLTLGKSGANARYICLPKSNFIKVPPTLSPERVVCLAETYLTAFQTLHLGQRGSMRYRENCLQGQSILIMDGYSPLGKAIIELSRLGGASICYGLISDDSENKEDGGSGCDILQQYKAVEEWGAIPLSSDPQEWLTLIGRQIDLLITTFDPNQVDKRMNNISADHWKALKKDGQVHVVCSHPGMTELEQRNLILGTQPTKKANDMKSFRLPSCRPGGREKMADRAMYYNLFDSWEGDRGSRAAAKKDLEHLIKLLEMELIYPEIADRFPLAKIAKAQRTIEHNKIKGPGHLVCAPWLREKTSGQQKVKTKRQAKEGRFLI